MRKPAEWQLDPKNVVAPRGSTVAFWRHGSMLTAMMPVEDARRLVREGRAFVISEGHVGALDEDGNYAA